MLRAGRSGAIGAERFRLPGGGLALCYARESNASAPLVGLPYVDPATLAHEFLHLFGASDKYGTPLRSFPDRSVTSRDIMRLDRDRLGSLRIDPLTASEIGWSRVGLVAGTKPPGVIAGMTPGGSLKISIRDAGPGRPSVQLASTVRSDLASSLTRCAASWARRASAYFARGAERLPSP